MISRHKHKSILELMFMIFFLLRCILFLPQANSYLLSLLDIIFLLFPHKWWKTKGESVSTAASKQGQHLSKLNNVDK